MLSCGGPLLLQLLNQARAGPEEPRQIGLIIKHSIAICFFTAHLKYIFKMGVKNLWSIIHSVCQKESLESMRGKTLCVDLSTWICQAEETLPLKHAVAKPYLRNTIFRVICLKRLGARLIFLTEGTPPELKWDVILARTNARTEEQKQGKVADARKKGRYQVQRAGKAESGNSKQVKPKRVGRSVFQRKINEVNDTSVPELKVCLAWSISLQHTLNFSHCSSRKILCNNKRKQ